MSEAAHNATPGGSRPPFTPELIDLDDHPDRDLMLFCACLARMRGNLEALEGAIACIPAVTAEGRRFKELSL